MKRKILLLFIASIVTALFVACGGGTSGNSDVERVTLSTAGTGGAWYPLGGGMANIINENSDVVSVSSEVSNGGVENLRLVHDGTSDFAFANSDIVYEAFHGEGTYEEDGKMDIVSIAYLYPSTFQAIVLEDSGIQSIEDLKGKVVAVGPPASSSEIMGWDILAAYGIGKDDIKGQTISFEEGVDALRDGNVDAVFVMSAAPNSQILEISTTRDIELLSIEQPIIDKLLEETPYYGEITVPANTYDGQEVDVKTLSLGSTLVASPNVSEEAAYEFTKHIFENLEEVRGLHSIAKDIELENAGDMPIPFHPGAKKYFEEVGLEIGE